MHQLLQMSKVEAVALKVSSTKLQCCSLVSSFLFILIVALDHVVILDPYLTPWWDVCRQVAHLRHIHQLEAISTKITISSNRPSLGH